MTDRMFKLGDALALDAYLQRVRKAGFSRTHDAVLDCIEDMAGKLFDWDGTEPLPLFELKRAHPEVIAHFVAVLREDGGWEVAYGVEGNVTWVSIALPPKQRDEERARREMTLGDYLAAHKTTLDEILGSEEEEEARGHDDGACKALWKNEYKIGPRREKAGGKS